MNLAQAGKWLGREINDSRIIEKFVQESQLVSPGDLFFAIQGERVDGHAFLEEVARKGAIAAIVSTTYQGSNFGMYLIPVEDVIEALQTLAKECFGFRKDKVIAVTGSVGKTTTKEFIATLLAQKMRVAKTPGSINSQVGLPLFILNCSEDVDCCVLEMGMSHPQEIAKLVEIAPPDIAVVTQIALAHAAFFPNGVEDIARAKAEIFSHPKTQVGIISAQAAHFDSIRNGGGCQKWIYGVEGCCLKMGDHGFQIVEGDELSPIFTLPFIASHLCENFLAAAVVARKMGLSWEEIIQGAQLLKMQTNRFEIEERDGVTFLNDSYNANVASMEAALKNLPRPKNGGKVIAVLGEMKELGAFSEECHKQVGIVALFCVDHLLCFGKECQPMMDLFVSEQKNVESFSSLEALRSRVFEIAVAGDVVLLKGSNSNQLWKILS